jgi:hypothetical protein
LDSEGAAAGAFVVAVAGGVSPAAELPGAGSAAIAFMEATVTTDAHATAQQVFVLMVFSSR